MTTTWERMSIDEYAAHKRNGGERVVRIRGTWWLEARPFFFRPAFPMNRIDPGAACYPVKSLVGGVLHLVPEGVAGNSCMNMFLYDDLREYALDLLDRKTRWIIRKGLEHFRAARITDLKSFTEEAYPVYRSFYDRTRYFYKSERTVKRYFDAWARTVFSNPKAMVLGAYRQKRLCAVDISYQVEDVIIDDVFFSDTASQGLKVTDFMLHILRETASSSDASFIFRGFPSGKESLDRAKVARGCRIQRLPAHFRINPLALCLGKTVLNASYKKLEVLTSPAAQACERPGG